ncbi:MAG: hypothetical protein JWP30_707 [Homoserinimonas sp.]|jgi:glycerophosphoryl diester phosphodiesterase|nr:hypothetical protein [Homoserinimonas sp.]
MSTTQTPVLRTRIPKSALSIPAQSGRLVIASALTLALVLVLILGPAASRSHAASMFGTLRAPGDPALIAGHRGDRSVAPENTLPALQAALDGSMLFVETDVQLTADEVPVLMHDRTVDRTTDGYGLVSALTLTQLQMLDAGAWYSMAFAGTRVPTLEAFLPLLRESRKKAMIEFKGDWPSQALTAVNEMIHAYGVQGRVVLAGFDKDTVALLKVLAPALPRVLIVRNLPEDAVGLALDVGAIALITRPAAVEEDPDVVERMHEAGLGILLYTLNKKKRWKAALALGVDGIITDRPSKLDAWLALTAGGT